MASVTTDALYNYRPGKINVSSKYLRRRAQKLISIHNLRILKTIEGV